MALYSTIWCYEKPGLSPDVEVVHRGRIGRRGVFRAVRRMRNGDAILLNGALGASDFWFDMLLAIYLRFFKRTVGVLVSDATWHPRSVPANSRAKALFPLYAWFLRRLFCLTKGTHSYFGFLSTAEVALVTQEARLRPGAARFTPFCSQLPLEMMDELNRIAADQRATDAMSAAAGQPARPMRFFAGGNSLRDYETLAAAAAVVGGEYIVATSNVVAEVPPNMKLAPLSHQDFFREMMRSDVVIVPLLPINGRSVGQQTYLNALALGKPLIVTDVIGVRDHLTADVHALVVPPSDPVALRAAIEWMLAPTNREARDTMARFGQQLATQMTFAHYASRLCDLLREIQSQLPLQTGSSAVR
jgi:glycosyltransferase involved in cell wall biosynthesis